jgi:hypothetical protein
MESHTTSRATFVKVIIALAMLFSFPGSAPFAGAGMGFSPADSGATSV